MTTFYHKDSLWILCVQLNYTICPEIFRKDSVDITTGTGRTIHRGAFSETKIVEEMQRAHAILHDDAIPLLVRVAVFHYFLAYIHPFL